MRNPLPWLETMKFPTAFQYFLQKYWTQRLRCFNRTLIYHFVMIFQYKNNAILLTVILKHGTQIYWSITITP